MFSLVVLGTCLALVASQTSQSTDPCSLKMERGRCRGLMAAWYFDAADGQCKPFTYGGCGGNANNFDSQAKCESRCAPSKQTDERDNALIEIAKPLLDGLDRIVRYIRLLQGHMRSKLNTESVIVDAA